MSVKGGALTGIGRALQTFVGTQTSLEDREEERKRQAIRDALLAGSEARAGRAEARLEEKDNRDVVQTLLSNLPEATDIDQGTATRIRDAGFSPFVRDLPALEARAPGMPGVTQDTDLSHEAQTQALPFITPALKAAMEATQRSAYATDARTAAAQAALEERIRSNDATTNYRMNNLERMTDQGNRKLDIAAIIAAITAGRANDTRDNASLRLNEAILARIGREAEALYPASDLEKALGEPDPKRLEAIEAYKARAMGQMGMTPGAGGMAPMRSTGGATPNQSAAQKAAEAVQRVRSRGN